MSELNKINYLNIGLMLLSCVVAFYLPFDLFLFAYAVLGPAHYLTEISWLHERNYFTKGKRDFIWLTILAVLIFLCGYVFKNMPAFKTNLFWYKFSTALIYIAFFSALVFVLVKDNFARFGGIVLVCITALITRNPHAEALFAIFLPTLIHVFVFTGLFILYGALKSKSVSGYISFGVFLLCPLLFVFIDSNQVLITEYAHSTYSLFQSINTAIYSIFDSGGMTANGIFESSVGIKIMRFIAFAYTYHYLNWFSKTTVIKWHQISKTRMIIIAVLWIASIAIYKYDYRTGFNWLFMLSFMHVFLEFPLNHTSFIGIFTELKSRITGKPLPQPVPGKKRNS